MSDPELKPCPFCGGEAAAAWHSLLELQYMMCKKCEAQGPIEHTEQAAIEAWNHRAEESHE